MCSLPNNLLMYLIKIIYEIYPAPRISKPHNLICCRMKRSVQSVLVLCLTMIVVDVVQGFYQVKNTR